MTRQYDRAVNMERCGADVRMEIYVARPFFSLLAY